MLYFSTANSGVRPRSTSLARSLSPPPALLLPRSSQIGGTLLKYYGTANSGGTLLKYYKKIGRLLKLASM